MTHIENRPPRLDPFSPILQQLRQILQRLGYLTAGIEPKFEALDSDHRVLPGSPLDTVLRLFFSRESVDPPALRDALEPLTLEQLLETGFCRADEHISANVLLQPYHDLLFAVGQLSLEPRPRPEDCLMRISRSSLEVAHLMVPRPSRNALDLGTGCGFLATLLSRTSEQVYAVDLNPTAVQFAEFNARWNALPNITCLQGNLFEPVRHLRFDLIVSNPPFFICPVPASSVDLLLFQHSGKEGDSFCIQLARDAATFLEEGGFFQMMFSWLELSGQDWQDKLSAAFSGLDCDVWALRTSEESAEDYLSTWCHDLVQNGRIEEPEIDSLRQQGLRYFQQNKFSSVGTGLLTLRRCSTRPNFFWFDEAPDDRSEPYGSSVAAIFDIRSRFDSGTDDALLQQKFIAAPDVVTIQKASLQNGQWQTTASELNRESGLKYTFSGVDPFLSHVFPCLDGRSSLREVLVRCSRDEHLPPAEVISKHLPSLRELLRFGFILPLPAEDRTSSNQGA